MLQDQQLDTRSAVVVTTAAAAAKFVLANQELEEKARARHILVIDDGPGSPLPSGTTSFRPLLCNDPKVTHFVSFPPHKRSQDPSIVDPSLTTIAAMMVQDCPTKASLGAWDAKQVAALHCISMHCTDSNCIAIRCTALHCAVLQCSALSCTALHSTALPYFYEKGYADQKV